MTGQNLSLNRKPFWLASPIFFLLASTLYAAPPSVVTQMYDNHHSGWNPNETQLTVANVKSSFKLLFKNTTDGQTYSQPLYIPALNMGSLGTHNVIFVATEHNTIYAFDADSQGAPLWSKNLTPTGETRQVAADYQNTRVPEVGITGTPVIDTATGTLYAVAASKTTGNPVVFHQRLHALDITNGNERANSPKDIVAKAPGTGGKQDGNGNVVFDPLVEFNRPALILFSGNIYTAWGSHEDNGNYQGWVIAFDKTSLAQVGVYNTSPNLPSGVGGGAIWQSSIGLVADDSSVYALTANGPFNASSSNYGDSALRLGPSLTLADFFTPCNQQELGDMDVDLGSGGMMVLPDQTSGPSKLITFAGKEGSIYLVDRTSMGGYKATTVADNVQCDNNVVQELWRVLGTAPTNGDSNRDAYWGAPAYFRDSSGRQYVYYSGDYSPLKEYDLANGSLTPGQNPSGKPNQTPSSTYNFPHGGTIPSISSNGGDTSTAIVWAIRRALPPSDGAGPVTLDAFAANDLTNEIVVDKPAGSWDFHCDAFLIPTVANGKVYVASGGELDVFGVTAAVPPLTLGAFRVSRRRINFGRVRQGETRTAFFRVRNPGKGDLHSNIGTLQAPFAVQNGGAITLARRTVSEPILVQFSPTAVGPASPQTLTITSDDPRRPPWTITVLGTGR